jgi:hypothetical protein
MFGVNPLDFNFTMSHMGTKMMVFNANVSSARAKPRSTGKFHTTFVVFKYSGEGGCGANNQFGDGSKFKKKSTHGNEITGGLR